MNEININLAKELEELNLLIVDSRRLLSIVQKLIIESERKKAWVIAQLFGSSFLPRRSRFHGQNEIALLVREAKSLCRIMKRNYKNSNINFELESIDNYLTFFVPSPFRSIIKYHKIRLLKKELNKFSVELEGEIDMLEKKELELEKLNS